MKTVFQVNLIGVAPQPGFSRHARWVFENLPLEARPKVGDEINWNLYPGWELPVARRRKFAYDSNGEPIELLIEFQSNQPHLIQHLLENAGWHTEILSDPVR